MITEKTSTWQSTPHNSKEVLSKVIDKIASFSLFFGQVTFKEEQLTDDG